MKMKNTVVLTDLRTREMQDAAAFLAEQGYEVRTVPESVCLWKEAELREWSAEFAGELAGVIHPAPPAFLSPMLETTEEEYAKARDEGPMAAWCTAKVFGVCALFRRHVSDHVPDILVRIVQGITNSAAHATINQTVNHVAFVQVCPCKFSDQFRFRSSLVQLFSVSGVLVNFAVNGSLQFDVVSVHTLKGNPGICIVTLCLFKGVRYLMQSRFNGSLSYSELIRKVNGSVLIIPFYTVFRFNNGNANTKSATNSPQDF
jgi:hypothetical protein